MKWLILSITIICLSCNKESKRNILGFYYPLEELENGTFYVYHPVGNDSIPPIYRYFKFQATEAGSNLLFQQLNHELEVTQFSNSQIVSNGSLIEDLFLYVYEQDSLHSIRTKVMSKNEYPFYIRDTIGVFLFKATWNSPLDTNQRTTLIKNRRFGGDTSVVFQGKKIPAITFKVLELLEMEEVGFSEVQYNGIEVFAEGLGLFYFEKQISSEFKIAYTLTDTMSFEQFERKFDLKEDAF